MQTGFRGLKGPAKRGTRPLLAAGTNRVPVFNRNH
jgi:hypothetical protein